MILGEETIFVNLHSAATAAWKDGIEKHNGLMRYFDNKGNKEHNKTNIIKYVGKIQKYEPSYKAPPINTSAIGCYIATCVYGSYDCPQGWTLRRYRDYTLAKTWYGRAFIRTYYAISPALVKWFGETRWFKRMWKDELDKLIKYFHYSGMEDTHYSDKTW